VGPRLPFFCEFRSSQAVLNLLTATSDYLGRQAKNQASFGNDHFRIMLKHRDQRGNCGRF
jgi:hypothetical protein